MTIKKYCFILILILGFYPEIKSQDLNLNEILLMLKSNTVTIGDILIEKKYKLIDVESTSDEKQKKTTYGYMYLAKSSSNDGSYSKDDAMRTLRGLNIYLYEPFDNSKIKQTLDYTVFNSTSYVILKKQIIQANFKLISTFDNKKDNKTSIITTYKRDNIEIVIITHTDNHWQFMVSKK
jgi:hypothetical protein